MRQYLPSAEVLVARHGADDPKTWRALRDQLRSLGARAIRVTGSHETWRFPDGESFVVVRNHLGNNVPIGFVVKFRRLRARRRVSLELEPSLLGQGITGIPRGPSDAKGRLA